jgi:thiol:disulfide interchange protein
LANTGGSLKETEAMSRTEESEPALILPEALIFILLGAFITAAGGIWFAYQTGQADSNRGVYYVCVGLMAMGMALIAVGLGIGRMALRTRSKATEDRAEVEHRPVGRKS